ncbi:hypothetical protein VNO77_34482 [Canavalia gladiata]|uniref:Uncharacterized protein n=1 Tax=Canavalia gladiata TaxID=3824 RepID=A0AAN9KEB3_CANGL
MSLAWDFNAANAYVRWLLRLSFPPSAYLSLKWIRCFHYDSSMHALQNHSLVQTLIGRDLADAEASSKHPKAHSPSVHVNLGDLGSETSAFRRGHNRACGLLAYARMVCCMLQTLSTSEFLLHYKDLLLFESS